MPTPRPIDPYRPPKKTEMLENLSRSEKKLSGAKLALIFFSPIFIFLGLAFLVLNFNGSFFQVALMVLVIGMIAVCGVFANHFAGDHENRAGRFIGFFLLTAAAQIFVNSIVAFGGCLVIFSTFG